VTDSPESIDQRAESIGASLARWRKKKRLTGQALADRVGMSQAKISRLENGVVAAEPSDVRLLAEELGMPATQVERLVELAEHADDRLTDWISAGTDSAGLQREIGRIEAAAKELRVFQPAVVPGLMQTSEYARAVMSDAKNEVTDGRFVDSAVAVSEGVNARMQRNEILLAPDHEFHFLITEQVLRNRVCEPAEMIGQIHRMREVAAAPNVHLLIVSDHAVLPIAPYHGFEVAVDRWVSVDLFNATLKSSGRKTVRAYRDVFDALARVALVGVNEVLDRYQADYARMLLPNSVAS
jgi:transcriptional regulator with XRE-family HTH domain